MLCLLSTASDVYSTSCSEETLNGAWKQRENAAGSSAFSFVRMEQDTGGLSVGGRDDFCSRIWFFVEFD